MRFKNYRNSFNKRNRIYSDDDILKMQLAAIFDNEEEILAQNRDIGIPTRSELESSQNTQWVKSFVGTDRLNNGGYWQSVLDEKQTPQYQESFIPKNNIGQLFANNRQNKPQYTLEGAIQHNVIQPIQNSIENVKNTYSEHKDKYKGLSPMAAAQKALAKAPIWKSSAKEYYQHSLKRADGEEPTEFMKENNDFYKLDEISDPELKQIYIEKAAKMHGLDVNDPATYDAIKNTEIVMPKENSQLYSQVKNSEAFQKWVAENYENIKNNTNKNTSIEFAPDLRNNDKFDLFATIHNADLKNSKINEDGSFSTTTIDPYDYENWDKRHYKDSKNIRDALKIFAHNLITPINNRAKEQQDAGQLERSILSTQINLTKEELEEILRKYGRIK